MKRFILLALVVSVFVLPLNKAQALEPKAKAFAIICTYGTVGGALLGFASMAFGSSSRVIAQGASLGLYAGIAFGAYVITSHRNRGNQSEVIDPYQEPRIPQGPPPGYNNSTFGNEDNGGGFGAPVPQEEPGGFFGSPQRTLEANEREFSTFKHKKGRVESLPIYFNLMDVRF